jgi:hypothetical protein
MSENKLYAQFSQEWRDYGHNIYPSLTVNNKILRGRLTPDNAFEDICASFTYEPVQCRAWQEEENISIPLGTSTGINLKTFLAFIFLLGLSSVCVIFVYRR